MQELQPITFSNDHHVLIDHEFDSELYGFVRKYGTSIAGWFPLIINMASIGCLLGTIAYGQTHVINSITHRFKILGSLMGKLTDHQTVSTIIRIFPDCWY